MRKRTKRKIMIIFHKEIQILIKIKRYHKGILYLNFFLQRKNQKINSQMNFYKQRYDDIMK